MTGQPWRKVQDQISEWALETLDTERAAVIICVSDLLARHLYQLQAGETMTDQQNSSAESCDLTVDSYIMIWSMRPPPGSDEGDAWEAGARQGWRWAEREVARRASLIPDAAQGASQFAQFLNAVYDAIGDLDTDKDGNVRWAALVNIQREIGQKSHEYAIAAQPPAAPVETFDVMSTIDPDYAMSFERETCQLCNCSNGHSLSCPSISRDYIDAQPLQRSSAGIDVDAITQTIRNHTHASDAAEAVMRMFNAQLQSSWQSIATAPKDGPAFLVWVPENLCIYEVIARDGNLSIFGGGFRDNLHRATLWMPLPASPVTLPHLARGDE